MVYGTQEPSRNEEVAVGTSTVIVSKPRNESSKRKMFYIRNTSPNAADIITINLGQSGSVTAGAGVVLKQNEIYAENNEAGFTCWQGTIRAVCATANGTIAVTER